MIATVCISYIYGIFIDKIKNDKFRLLTLILVLGFNIINLCYFKYTNFIISNINKIISNEYSLLNIALPLGISFYTFQNISYILDIYWKKEEPQKNIINLATYIFLFPQLIAGPIVRYSDVNKQLENREHTFEKFSSGVRKFIIGLSKKVILANTFGELSKIIMDTSNLTVLGSWIYAISFTLQIYFDFSGYSDMAIGLGKMFGFEFMENFNYPYISKSITEFWRRWHISLSSWFKDYVYIPLGGNRKGKLKQIRNILIVWALTGIWHGAGWNFIIWGLYFGMILIIEKLFLLKTLEKIPNILKRVYVFLIVIISFVIFENENLIKIKEILGNMFIPINKILVDEYSKYYLKSYLTILIIGLIGVTPLFKNIIIKIKEKEIFLKIINFIEPFIMVILLMICTSYLVDNSFNPFLYFRF